MKRSSIFGLLILAVLLVTMYPVKKSAQNAPRLAINGNIIQVQVADTMAERTQGLSGRSSLGEYDGMLFIMNTKELHTFWMKGMQFPIDIIWIDGNAIVDISENVPVPNNQYDIPRIQPSGPVDRVLEINAGSAKKLGIAIGDRVEFILQ